MKTIYKYTFDIKPEVQDFEYPKHGALLQIDKDTRNRWEGAMWFEVDLPEWPTKESEVKPILKKVKLAVVGTGGIIPEGNFEYYGSFMVAEFMWHIYMDIFAYEID